MSFTALGSGSSTFDLSLNEIRLFHLPGRPDNLLVKTTITSDHPVYISAACGSIPRHASNGDYARREEWFACDGYVDNSTWFIVVSADKATTVTLEAQYMR